jgi:transketolase
MNFDELRPDRGKVIDDVRARLADLRVDILETIAEAKSGHPGGSLSAIDLLATLFCYKLRFRPDQPDWPERDRFVLSKGHAVPALYTMMAHLGYFPREELRTLRKLGSRLQGHPANRLLPGIEAPTGSLGQGLSVAMGMAIASKLDGGRWRVYCTIGDGESQAGQIWEAAMASPKFGLDNLCVLADYNQGQNDKLVKDVLSLEPAADKWRAFGWHAVEINGHDVAAIAGALDEAERTKGRPTVIVARTVKGKGVSFVEGVVGFHGKALSATELTKALAELNGGPAAQSAG